LLSFLFVVTNTNIKDDRKTTIKVEKELSIMKNARIAIGMTVAVCFLAGSLLAQNSRASDTKGNQQGTTSVMGTNSAANPGVCDGSGIGRQAGRGNGKAYGVGNGTGNKGNRPQDGTGYGAKNLHPMGSTGNTGGFSQGQCTGRQGGGFGGGGNNR
jgi:hypothetical protein